MNIIITVLLIILVIFILWQLFIRTLRRLFDFPASAFIGNFLDSDFRRKIQSPDKIISRSGIKKGMKTLENSMNFRKCEAFSNSQKSEIFEDFRCPENQRFSRALEVGCGSGAFTTFGARAVGDKGEVFALDIQPEMLKQIENKLKMPENRDIKNIQLIEGDALNIPLEDNSFDLVYTITAFQEIPDKNKALKEMKRVLKPEGILATLENSMNFRCLQIFRKSKIFACLDLQP